MSTIQVTIAPRVKTSTVLRTGATGLPGAVGAVGPQGSAGVNGIDGREVQLQKSSTHVQWRYEGETAWSNLVALSEITGPQGSQGIQGIQGLPGADGSNGIDGAPGAAGADGADGVDGREVELRTNSTHVQWRYVGTATWADLVSLASITGPQGSQGPAGPQGPAGADSTVPGPQGPVGPQGSQGPAGANGSDASVTSANITTALGFTPDNPSSSRTPTAHTHPISDVSGLQTALDGKQPTGDYATNATVSALVTGVSSVAGKTGAVSLAKADVGLGNVDNTSDSSKPISTATQTALNGKANSTHTHVIADVPGLQTALDGKQTAGSYAAASHSHSIGDVTGLQTVLDGKQAAGSYAPATGISPSAITGTAVITTDSRLSDARTPTAHSHEISEVTGLQDALDGKQAALGFSPIGDAPADGQKYVRKDGAWVLMTDGPLPPSGFPDGAIAYWRLNDDGSGGLSLVDATGNGNTLTNNNGVALGTGKINGGAGFDSSANNYLSISSTFDFSGDFSISGWLKPIDGNFQWVFASNNSGGLALYSYLNTVSGTRIGLGDFVSASQPLTNNTWSHVAIVRNSGTISLFINSTEDGSAFASDDFSGVFNIGADIPDGLGMTGMVDEVGVWNRALSSGEIAALYNSGNGLTYPTFPQGAIAYWNLDDDGSGNVSLVDATGNGNALTNFNSVALGTGKVGGDAITAYNTYLSSSLAAGSIGTGDFTVSLWFKRLSSISTYPSVFSETYFTQFNCYVMDALVPDGLRIAIAGASDASLAGTITSGTWYHLAISRANGTVSIFLDGQQISSYGADGSIDLTTFYLGYSSYGGDTSFGGEIDEVGIWSRALSAGEVAQLYNSGNGLAYPA